MRCGRVVRLGVLAAVAAVALAAVPSAPAITKQKATQIALKRLQPQKELAAIVFALPQPLGPRTKVVEASQSTASARRLGKRAWLFWEDLAPYAGFAHPSRLVLVDDRTGKIVRDRILDYWPLVNGRPPPFLTTPAGYESATYRVYPAATSLVDERPVREPAEWEFPGLENNFKKDDFAGHCLVTVGAYGDVVIGESFDLWNALADRLGLPKYRVMTENPSDPTPDSADLERTLEQAVADGCKDVLVFIAGHGYSFPGSKVKGSDVVHDEQDPFRDGGTFDGSYGGLPGAVIPGVSTVPIQPGAQFDPFEIRPGQDDITSRELRNVLLAFSERLTFKVVIESCFSGRIINDLKVDKPPNLLFAASAAAADEVAYGNLWAPPGKGRKIGLIGVRADSDGMKRRYGIGITISSKTRNKQSLGEFTRGIAAGILQIGKDPESVAALDAKPGSILVNLLRDAFTLGEKQDAGRASGATHPGVIGLCEEPRRTVLTHPGQRGDLIFQSDRGGDFGIWEADADGTSPRPLVDLLGRDEFNASASPSGTRIVFQSAPEGTADFDVYISDVEPEIAFERGGLGALVPPQPHALVGGPTNDGSPTWCDENTIVFARTLSATDADLWVVRPDGAGLRRLTTGPSRDSFPTCHPGGQRVAFISNRDGPPEIWEMNLNGTGLRKVVSGVALDPDYSPDGLSLAYVAPDPQDQNLEVFTRNLATGDVAQRTVSTGVENRLPHFAPDSTSEAPLLVFTRRTPVVGREPLGDNNVLEQNYQVNHSERLLPTGPGSGGSWRPAPVIGVGC
jgi:TolB protein